MKGRKKGAGTLELRKGVWMARWVVDGKRFARSTGTGNRREAEKRLAEFSELVVRNNEVKTLKRVASRLGDAKAQIQEAKDAEPALQISEMWEAYATNMARPDTGAVTMRGYKFKVGKLVNFVKDRFPDVKELRGIDEKEASAFVQFLAKNVTANTFNKYVTLFRHIWKILWKQARLTANPWEGIAKKTLVTHSRRELTIEELGRVYRATAGEMRTLFTVGIYTGLRLGDCATLDWGHVDMKRRIISLIPHKTARSAHGKPVEIFIHPSLFVALNATPAGRRRGYVMPKIAKEYLHDATKVSKEIREVYDACGIKTASEREGVGRSAVDVGFHSLRHTFVSMSANAGTPLAVVQAIVGHSNPAMTAHYFHESQAALQSAIDVLPAIGAAVDVNALPAAEIAPAAKPNALQAILKQLHSLKHDELEQLRDRIIAILNEEATAK